MQAIKFSPSERKRLFITLAVIAVIVVIFITQVDLAMVTQQLSAADGRYILAASTMLLVVLVLHAVRWRLLLANKPGALVTFHAGNIGHVVNTFIPLRAGEAARIFALRQNSAIPLAEAAASVMVERMIFEALLRMAVLAGAVAVGLGLTLTMQSWLGGLGAVVIGFAGLWWFVSNRETVLAHWPPVLARLPRTSEEGIRSTLSNLFAGLTSITTPRRLALALLWTVALWGCAWGFYYLVLLALHTPFTSHELLALSLGSLGLAPPSAPTQPGVYQASIVAPLAVIGFDNATLTAYAIMLQMLFIVWILPLVIWGLLHRRAAAAEDDHPTTEA